MNKALSLPLCLLLGLSFCPGLARASSSAAPQGGGAAPAPPVAAVPEMTVEKWREDLRHMAAEMRARHKNLYHTTTREQFEAAVRRLDERIPALARHEIIVELMRLVAMVGDGHTHMGMAHDPLMKFRRYPVRLYFFKDGLFVQAASPEYGDAVGARVVRVGRATAEEAYRAVREVTSRDSEMDARMRAAHFLAVPEILHALRVADNMERLPLVVEKAGRTTTIELRPVELSAAGGPSVPPGWVSASDGAQRPAPLYLKDRQNNFWFEHLQEARAVYVKYNAVANKPDETVADFFRRVFEFVEQGAVERLVIDVRHNGGGNNFLNRAIITGVIRADRINRRGRLFVITGRETFSAAQNFVNEMEKYTNVLFVGEPTGGRPNHFGDSARVVLPNSGLTVRASTVWWQDADPRDNRPWTAPHVAAELTSEDYRANHDPALAAALTYVEGKSLSDSMAEALSSGDTALALKRYREYRADPAHAYLSTEGEINRLGYLLLGMKRHEQAVEIFKLNVADYPQSANVYDSLSDAHEAAGQTELAIKLAEKALEALPGDPNNDQFKNGLRDAVVGKLRRLKGAR